MIENLPSCVIPAKAGTQLEPHQWRYESYAGRRSQNWVLAFAEMTLRGSLLMRITLAALLLTTALSANAQACNYTQLDPAFGKIETNGLTIDFGQPDKADNPSAWQGPIAITQPDTTICKVNAEVGTVQQPILQDAQHLMVTTYYSNSSTVFTIDKTTCRILSRNQSFTGNVHLDGDKLYLGDRMVPLGKDCVP